MGSMKLVRKAKPAEVSGARRGDRTVHDPKQSTWDFPKIRIPYFGVLIIRILLFRVFSETLTCELRLALQLQASTALIRAPLEA